MRVVSSLLLLLPAVASEFVSGGTFGLPAIGPYNNCSGTRTEGPGTFAVDTLPNINPDDPVGWEKWDLTMHQSGLFLFMRWIQGDPASYTSVPANGTFELVATFSNGTSYRTHTSGHKLTFTNESGYSISIAGNTLSWDDSQIWFNTTLDVNGLTATFQTQSIMLDKYAPNAGGIIGQLTENLFTGTPVTRGNSSGGSIVFPWGESILLDAESVLNHMFSVKPIQTLVSKYAIRVFHSLGTDFEDTFIYESSRAPNCSLYDAFFLARAEVRGTSFEPYIIYAGINNELLSVQQINATTTQAQLAGCNYTDQIPFSWNYTLPNAPITEDIDSAGGKTSFYFAILTASEPYGGAAQYQTGAGHIYTYEAPGVGEQGDTPGGDGAPDDR